MSQQLRTIDNVRDPRTGGSNVTAAPGDAGARLFPALHLTLQAKMLLAFFVLILIMGVPYLFLAVPVFQYQAQYDRIIDNITTANSINGYIKPAIDAEMWDIIAGKEDFYTADQYAILDEVDQKLAAMRASATSQRGRVKLRVIQNTMNTLRHDVDRVGAQLSTNTTFDDNMVLMERIRDVSALVEANIQDYMLFEVNRTGQEYRTLQAGVRQWLIVSSFSMVIAVIFSVVAAWRISRGIYLPIKKLHNITTTIARADLEPLVTADNVDEIAELGMSFNIMVGKVRELLDAKIKEQENLKKAELRALQAQINPHFLYNTLDTIIWMAEANRPAQVVELVRALSRFFRITLSKGKDWITVREEIEHISSYLTIQKIRYRDILDYVIDIEPEVLEATMLKLTLQPLVENALYHGIKNKRSGGVITVRGRRWDDNRLLVEVSDNGIGMTAEKVAQLRTALASEGFAGSENGFGLCNVNQRVKLYYGKQYGLTLESEYGQGTRVLLDIPLQ